MRRFVYRAKGIREGECGFTLIELLVVVIIIGILAAIAIPTFLAQRERANIVAMSSDLRNAAAVATSCSSTTANDGSYTNCASVAQLTPFGFNTSDDVTVIPAVTGTGGSVWSATATHTDTIATGSFSTAGADAGEVVITP